MRLEEPSGLHRRPDVDDTMNRYRLGIEAAIQSLSGVEVEIKPESTRLSPAAGVSRRAVAGEATPAVLSAVMALLACVRRERSGFWSAATTSLLARHQCSASF